MVIVAGTLLFHALVVLPILLKVFGKVSPIGWARAMAPALMTAFTTSSSSMTLPVTLDCVEKRGKAGNKVSSFVLPLGATINMDGTALYECVGVIFLSQYYASHSAVFDLTLGMQFFVVITALLASIGAAGIPSAGLVLKAIILKSLGLPDDGVLLLLAIDRPLDMLRTAVNVWSDSCGAAIIASTEGVEVLAAER
jgi:Na+/H+-dicarboxylate symporter